MRCCRACARAASAASSTWGASTPLVASPFKSAYVAAKHALVGFSKVIALETANTDITVNTLCPSYVKTPLVDKQIADQARVRGMPESEVISQIMLKPMPKGVFIGIDELAGVTELSRLRRRAEHHRTDDRHRRRVDRPIDVAARPWRWALHRVIDCENRNAEPQFLEVLRGNRL